MQWTPLPSRVDNGDDGALHRFGHSLSPVDATHTWGTTLLCLFGGVRERDSGSAAAQHQQHSSGGAGAEQHAATNDLLVLSGDGESWFRPQLQGSQVPPARTFHAAAVVGQEIYVFGGHVLGSAGDDAPTAGGPAGSAGKRPRRTFFADLWVLSTVRGESVRRRGA